MCFSVIHLEGDRAKCVNMGLLTPGRRHATATNLCRPLDTDRRESYVQKELQPFIQEKSKQQILPIKPQKFK